MNPNTNDISQFCSMKRIKVLFLQYRSPGISQGIFAGKERSHAEMENGRNAATKAATRG